MKLWGTPGGFLDTKWEPPASKQFSRSLRTLVSERPAGPGFIRRLYTLYTGLAGYAVLFDQQ
jgi:hypothetical protein